MKASDLFIRALEAEGVTHIFGVPGEENLDLLESLHHSSISLILTRHEQAAGFMAATVGRLTGKAGVCLSTLGPGATNLVTAAAYAQLGGMPMLMITGQKPVKRPKQGQFQIVDVVQMMRPLTKYTRTIISAPNVPSRVREAIRLAEEERPGAAHLELPEDVAAEEAEEQVFPAGLARRPSADEKSIMLALRTIESAKRPLILIGAGANRKLTSKMLQRFVDKTKIHFITTQMGKGVVDERHPLCLGNAALSQGDLVHEAIEQADLIINVGHDVIEKPPFIMRPGGRQVIHINFNSAAVDPVYFPQVEVIGDIANSIWRIGLAITVPESWDFDRCKRIREAWDKDLAEAEKDDRYPLSPQRLVSDVRAVVPSDGILALDNGLYKIWFARNYRAHEPNTVLLDNALATMGAGLPVAMAAKLIFPNRLVMAICGDGGFLMNAQELETAVRIGLDFVVLILCDRSYGMIKWKQEELGFPVWGLDFDNPDFVKFAEAHGAHGHRVNEVSELRPLLERCTQAKGVHVIDVPVDYSDTVCALAAARLSQRPES